WGLYKNSEQGSKQIKKWMEFATFPDDIFAKEASDTVIESLKKINLKRFISNSNVNWYKILKAHYNAKVFRPDEAKAFYINWIGEGIEIGNTVIAEKNSFKSWTSDIAFYSLILSAVHPEYFFPYILDCEFFLFQKIGEEFEIPIPDVPKKNSWEDRATYYIDLCDAFLEFRQIADFSPPELFAFLYDFAPLVVKEQTDQELPSPSKVWFVGANRNDFKFLDNAVTDSFDFWQGNVDARRGDIIVMYCLTPRSYIHSIWRVSVDGFVDPFFYYYSAVGISQPIKLDIIITQKELKMNPVWENNPLIRKNLQGVNGYPIKYNEYIELLTMLEAKGQNTASFPKIKPTNKLEVDDLMDERAVEIKLIEPLLNLLNYKPNDWIRQMSIKMGRGERNYPDYCFNANTKRGEESAKMVLESKFEIKTQKDLQDAYFQAKSYALRLQAEKFVIAAKEGIWIFQPKNGYYKLNEQFSCNWVDIENPDIFHLVKQLIGK
ncbi:MAG: hypothetical protein RBR87_15910, partial [Bacteroidales bacterium]|nr:hypothetical protein [Bacteroidales bacterium]